MTPYIAVLLYGGWMLLITLLYAFPRVPQGLSGKKPLDSWERDKVSPDPPFLQRAKAAHLNATESFAVFAAIVVIAGLMNQLEAIAALAPWVLYARIAQTLIHMSGASFIQILLRATAFVAQVFLMLFMIYSLVV